METTMELDDLKQAWQTIDRRLEQHNTLQLHVFRDGKLDTLRRRLRPLAWGQAIQMLLGVVTVMLSVAFWTEHRTAPHLLVAGIVMHVYGVAMIAIGGVTLGWLRRLDYTAPVLIMQKQLAGVRRVYVIGGMCIGLPWWLLWLPAMMVFFKAAFGADLYVNAPSVIWIGIGTGIAGLLATGWFHHWSRQANRPRLARMVEDSLTGSSLRRAQSVLDELRQFEQE